MDPTIDLADIAFHRHATELAATWQARALRAALRFDRGFAFPRDKLGMVLLSIIGDAYGDPRQDALRAALQVIYPQYESIAAPFLCSAGKIAKTGHVMADMITIAGERVANQGLFASAKDMESALRRFADRMQPPLTDGEREELFAAAKRWVVCDYRLDPTMDPKDPDAKHLTLN